jgi:hypothetical protein
MPSKASRHAIAPEHLRGWDCPLNARNNKKDGGKALADPAPQSTSMRRITRRADDAARNGEGLRAGYIESDMDVGGGKRDAMNLVESNSLERNEMTKTRRYDRNTMMRQSREIQKYFKFIFHLK